MPLKEDGGRDGIADMQSRAPQLLIWMMSGAAEVDLYSLADKWLLNFTLLFLLCLTELIMWPAMH